MGKLYTVIVADFLIHVKGTLQTYMLKSVYRSSNTYVEKLHEATVSFSKSVKLPSMSSDKVLCLEPWN